MLRIDKLILKDMIGPFVNGLFMFLVLVFAAGYLFKATDLLVSGVPLPIVTKLVMLNLPSVLTDTFPMAMLLGGLMAFGRLSADREAVAAFAAGISFTRMMRPVIYFGIAVSVLAFIWNDRVVPPTTTAFWDTQQEAVKHLLKSQEPLKYTVDSPSGVGIAEQVYIDGGFDARTQSLLRVTILRFSQDPARRGRPEAILYCERAQAGGESGGLKMDEQGLNWTYYNGTLTTFVYGSAGNTSGPKDAIDNFRVLAFKVLQSRPGAPNVGKTFDEVLSSDVNDANRMTFTQLRRQISKDRGEGRLSQARGEEVDLYGKIALPLASLVFGILGAALGMNTQRGGTKTVGFGVAIFIVFLYWVFYHATFVIGKNGGLPPALASFLADIVGGTVDVILIVRGSV